MAYDLAPAVDGHQGYALGFGRGRKSGSDDHHPDGGQKGAPVSVKAPVLNSIHCFSCDRLDSRIIPFFGVKKKTPPGGGVFLIMNRYALTLLDYLQLTRMASCMIPGAVTVSGLMIWGTICWPTRVTVVLLNTL